MEKVHAGGAEPCMLSLHFESCVEGSYLYVCLVPTPHICLNAMKKKVQFLGRVDQRLAVV
jgi:hypothetical protein